MKKGEPKMRKAKKAYSINDFTEEKQREIVKAIRETFEPEFYDEGPRQDFTEKLKEQGFNDPTFHWSGFWSQGDGASFTATVDIGQYIKAHSRELAQAGFNLFDLRKVAYGNHGEDWEVVDTRITQSGHYYHAGTMSIGSIEVSGEAPEELEKAMGKLEDLILSDARDLAEDFYKALEKEYEYESSFEYIKEEIEANDHKFTIEGEHI